MSGKKNEAFEKAWKLYTNKDDRKRLEKFLPGVYRMFSSGNKMQAEMEFNAELSTLDKSTRANEIAWAASGKIPEYTIGEIFTDKSLSGNRHATEKKLLKLNDVSRQYFAENPEEYSDALKYIEKVNGFKAEGYDDEDAKMYAIPVDKFKAFNKTIDQKAGYKFAGKDNVVHSVSQDYHDRRVAPKDGEIITGDLVDKMDQDKKTLSKIFVGPLSNQFEDEKNLGELDLYAKDLGFRDSDALMEYLDKSYDRSNRLKEQEDDGLAAAAGKTLFAPWVNRKWDEGVPASTTDVVHDAALAAIEFAPQGKAAGTIGRVLRNAAPKTRTMANVEKAVTNPWMKYVARKASLPAEAAYLDNVLDDKQNGIDWMDIGKQTLGNSSLDIGLTTALRGISRLPLFSKLPSDYVRGGFLESKKDIARGLEERAYEIALENEAGQAAHNLMLRLNPDYRANPSVMYRALSKNKVFNDKYPLGNISFDRVFNDAWNSAKHAGAESVPTGKPSLKKALGSLDSYKKTKDFKNALEAAAWEKSGYKGRNILNEIRDDKYRFNLGLEDADAAKQAALMLLYDDYSKKGKGLSGILKFLKYEGTPEALRVGENIASVNRLYGPIYGRALGGFGLRKQDEPEK